MTRDELVTAIKELVGFRSDSRTDGVILRQLPIQQKRIENGPTKPWFLLSEYSTYVTTIGEERVQVPTDFISEHDEDGLSVLDAEEAEYVSLIKSDLDELRANFGVETGFPQGYALAGEYFRLFPTPDAAYTLRMLYYKREEELTSTSSENKHTVVFPELLMGMTGLRAAQILRDVAAQNVFREMLAEARAEMFRQNELRAHANAAYQIGGQH